MISVPSCEGCHLDPHPTQRATGRDEWKHWERRANMQMKRWRHILPPCTSKPRLCGELFPPEDVIAFKKLFLHSELRVKETEKKLGLLE